ncbi:MAG: DUF1801 domain-containing protein [Thermoplasmata archaeon]|nr:DUF1801 domain-containing protein [Thermoplasmata archaeon]
MAELSSAVEATIRAVAPTLTQVVKYGAPTFQGRGDVCTIGVWKQFVAVGFWNGAKLAPRHPLLEGTAKTTRVVKLRTIEEATSAAFRALIRDAVRADLTQPAHPK